MKNLFKKVTVAVCAASAVVTLAAASITVSATDGTRSMDQAGQVPSVSDNANDNVSSASGTQTSTQSNTGSDTVTRTAGSNAAPAPAANSSVNNVTTTNTAPQKASSGWSGFWWFLISVVVNFILSCWVGNRFYRLAKKSAQGSAEIRALRKDIEEKFASTIREIDEPAAEIVNRNESYARNEEGIEMPPRKSRVELSEDEMERISRWDSQRVREPEDAVTSEDDDEDIIPERKPVRRSYQPTRKTLGIDYEDDEEDDEYEKPRREPRRPARMPISRESKTPLSSAKNKAKDFLSNVFPFDE